MELKKLRMKAKLTQHELAERLGVHFTVVSKWERGVQAIPVKYHDALASILEVSARMFEAVSQPKAPEDDSYRKWIEDVVSSDLEPKTKVILMAMLVIVDLDTDVCVATFAELARASKATEEDVRDAWPSIVKSGFIRPLGMEAVAKIMK